MAIHNFIISALKLTSHAMPSSSDYRDEEDADFSRLASRFLFRRGNGPLTRAEQNARRR